MNKLKSINWGLIISIALWCVITLIRVMHHSPWHDETIAWLISQELNFIEMIKVMKIEGHTFIWYLLLMPFAKTNFMYPYSMLLLNWLFCFIAILILWLKAPFNNWIKFLISFSFPFLALYPVVARCYAIGIMFLFAIAAMDNKKIEHPNWYALLLILCANTSIMAMVGATVFGVFFIYELIKNKKSLFLPFLIMVFGAILVLIQLYGSTNDIIGFSVPMGRWFLGNVFFDNIILNVLLLLIYFIILTVFCYINKVFPLFLVCSYCILFAIICVYSGNIWHWFFFYVYFIVSSWKILSLNNLKMKNIYMISLGIISFFYVIYIPNADIYKEVWLDKSKSIATTIKKSKMYQNSNLIITNVKYYSLIPYLKNSNIKISNYCSGKIADYYAKIFIQSKYCRADHSIKRIDPLQLDKVYDETRQNYMFANIENELKLNIMSVFNDKKFVLKPILVSKYWNVYSVQKLN